MITGIQCDFCKLPIDPKGKFMRDAHNRYHHHMECIEPYVMQLKEEHAKREEAKR